jgi:hypothetical protein
MKAQEAQRTLFDDLAVELPEQQRAEFYKNLHVAGIGPNDVELARLLRSLQLYKAYYESIPAAVQAAAAEIERLSAEAKRSAEACARLTGEVVQEAGQFRQELTEFQKHVQAAAKEAAESLSSKMMELLSAGFEKTVLQPLQGRITQLTASNKEFDDVIKRNDQAVASLERSSAIARRIHFGVYAFGALLITCSLSLASWYFLHQWYSGRIARERAVLVQQVEKNRAVLLELAESHRTLELLQDPEYPHRRLLVMKDASGWKSAKNHGVIEFETEGK